MDEEELSRNIKQFTGKHLKLSIAGTIFETAISILNLCPLFVKVLEKGNKETKCTPGDDTIFVDRDPKHFPFILQFLRIQDSSIIFSELRSKTVKELNELLTEVYFYGLDTLYQIVLFEINNRYRCDAENSSIAVEFSPLSNIATRKSILADNHHTVIVGNSCKDLKVPRYVEFRINCTGNSIMIGIVNKIPISSERASHPGSPTCPGFSYHSNGNLYQNATCKAFGPTFTAVGDRVGLLIDIQKKKSQVLQESCSCRRFSTVVGI